ncbi:L-threonate dehydrogenase-like protein [Drosera capensis]
MAKRTVGFLGFDELSLEMAASLIRAGYSVNAFDSQMDSHCSMELSKLGGVKCTSPSEVWKGAAALVILVPEPNQMEEIIFGPEGGLKGLPNEAVVVLRTAILPSYVQSLEKRLADECGRSFVVDAYVCRATSKSSDGKVMITSSGRHEAIAKAHPILSAMSEKVYIFYGELGAGSKIKMVNQLLEGIHLVSAIEAISLGIQAGIHPMILYDIISNAAGSSRIFKKHIPSWLKSALPLQHAPISLVESLGSILGMAKSLVFPLPLLAVAQQQLILGSSHGGTQETLLHKIWENVLGVKLEDVVNEELYNPEEVACQLVERSKNVKQVAFIGLGAMGFGMATHLVKSNFTVRGYDVYKPTLTRFANAGGVIGNSPAAVSEDVDVLVVMVTNEIQAESVLFGDHGAVAALPAGACIILSSTVSPGFVTQLDLRLHNQGKNLKLVDAPVSGGVQRAAMGTLTIMASGTEEALELGGSVLSAMSEKLYIIKGGCGSGSCVKMVNQLLAGVHIASTAEALAFGARLGLNTRTLFDFVTNSDGTSWMFENRGPHMLDNDYTPHSALNIFVKDLGIVSHESLTRKIPLHVAVTAHELFLAGSAAGWGSLDDAAVVKVYESLTGVKVEGKLPPLSKESVMQSLPSEWPVDPTDDIRELIRNSLRPLVVLDDDPTGTQTVHDIEVLTEWKVESLIEQFRKMPKCFFILTNSRSLEPEKASYLVKEICRNLHAAAKSAGNMEFTVVLRGDSTLRGHFPEATDAAVSVLGEMDAWIICPFFLHGGRYTIGDVHYVADSDRLVPAGDTEFARDHAFGYKCSNLREWVEEKTRGCIPASEVASISIELLRKGGPDAVCEQLCSLKKGSTCIVNAASERDMAVFALGMIQAEFKGKRFLCRTAANFVSARVGIISKPPISPKDLGRYKERAGGLIVVGSYVPKTTKQVEELKIQCEQRLKCIEVDVENVAMKSSEEREQEISQAAEMADIFIGANVDTLIFTSRRLITGKTPSDSLEINFKVSSSLVEIVRRITTKPRYILAKGGVTSSDLATKALEARSAVVVGQALPGVPLWQLSDESRHPGVPYIVFPGNVGDHTALAVVVRSWARPSRLSSAKDLLLKKVGMQLVLSTSITWKVLRLLLKLQKRKIIHPAALKQGGLPLVACCVAAAEQSSVPITVHFDHGTSKQDLIEVIQLGFDSIMADGSHLPFKDNISFTKYISNLAHTKNILVEAELGRLSGTEDDLTVEEYEARLTDINQARDFIDDTGIDALAVCIGNVHGKYPPGGPNLKLDLLKDLHALASEKGVFLVLHGASGLSEKLIKECVNLGIRKFNVNTEVRRAYMDSLAVPAKDLVHAMASAIDAMKAVVAEKMRLFGSAGKA